MMESRLSQSSGLFSIFIFNEVERSAFMSDTDAAFPAHYTCISSDAHSLLVQVAVYLLLEIFQNHYIRLQCILVKQQPQVYLASYF